MKKPAFTLIFLAIAALTLLARLERKNNMAGPAKAGIYPNASTDKTITPKK